MFLALSCLYWFAISEKRSKTNVYQQRNDLRWHSTIHIVRICIQYWSMNWEKSRQNGNKCWRDRARALAPIYTRYKHPHFFSSDFVFFQLLTQFQSANIRKEEKRLDNYKLYRKRLNNKQQHTMKLDGREVGKQIANSISTWVHGVSGHKSPNCFQCWSKRHWDGKR